MVAKIEPRPSYGRVDHGQILNALFAQCRRYLRERGYMAPAERAVQAAEEPDEQWFPAAKIVDGDLAVACDCVEHNVGRSLARLQWSNIDTLRHLNVLWISPQERLNA
jgi:hypothetical protein